MSHGAEALVKLTNVLGGPIVTGMRSVTVHEAKTHLSRLLRDVENGEQIEIRRGDVPIAVLSARPSRESFRDLEGAFAGQVVIHDNFNDDEDIARDFGMID